MDETAFRLPGVISARNFLRIAETSDEASDMAIEQSERRKQKFLREVTELAGRLMIYRRQLTDEKAPAHRHWKDADIPRPINIFISHSKADGSGIAKAMRDYMNQKSQLRPFFDETDLALGFRYADVLKTKAKRGTAAMIAIYSDSYPFRPWCQAEIKLARQPQNITASGLNKRMNCWWLNPLVVVSALSHVESRCIPEFGQATVIRWEAGKEPEIIGILLRELFFQTYNYLWARNVCKDLLENPGSKVVPRLTHFLTWIPSIRTLEEIRTACPKAWRPGLTIYHPGESMIHEELRATGMLPDKSVVRSFDEIYGEHMRNELPHDWPMLGISLSTDEKSVARYGYAKEHLHYYLLIILRGLLRCGARIAFGGDTFCDCDPKYTESMIQLAQEELRNHPPQHTESEGILARESFRPVFHCFMAWPQGTRVSIERRAEFIGTCVFLEDIDGCLHKGTNVLRNDTGKLYHEFRRSLALSKARYLMTYGTRDADGNALDGIRARVVLGGICEGFEGIMPGILEEVYWALRRNLEPAPNDGTALYIIGGFGGAARLLADYLVNDNVDDVPPWATARYYLDENNSSAKSWRDGFQRLIGDYQKYTLEESDAPWARSSEYLYKDLEDSLRQARSNPSDTLRNGLSIEDNRRLMTSQDISEIGGLIEKGLKMISAP